jgi:uncharacterized RDD family membrane protein YckC
MLYDSLLVLAIWLATLLILVSIRGDAVTGPVIPSLLFIETYLFFAYFWLRHGETLGMLAWQLRLRPAAGTGAPTLGQITRRFIGAGLGLAAGGLGYLWVLFDPQKRSWSDLMSNTRVLYSPKSTSQSGENR